MLGAEKTVTVTHRWYDGEAGAQREAVFTVAGCSWHGGPCAAADAAGRRPAGVYRVRLPGGGFCPAEEYAGAGWTVAPEDTLCCGGRTATVLAVHDDRGKKLGHIFVKAE